MALNIDLVNGAINIYETGGDPRTYFGATGASGKFYASGSSLRTIQTISIVSSNLDGVSDGLYSYIPQSSTTGHGIGAIFQINVTDGVADYVSITSGGAGYGIGDDIFINGDALEGTGGSLTIKVTSLLLDGILISVGGDDYQVMWDNLVINGATPADLPEALSLLAVLFSSTVSPYKVFSFLISQFGSDSPTIIPLQNTLGISPDSVGKNKYGTGICSLAFGFIPDLPKTAVFISNYTKSYDSPDITGDTFNVSAGWAANELFITSSYGTDLTDSVLNNCPIEIRVYN